MYVNICSSCKAPADPQTEKGAIEPSSPPEGAAPSSRPSVLCPARVVLCLAANQICVKWLMCIPGAEPPLSSADTWSQPSVMPPLDPGGSVKHRLTCPPPATHSPQACFALSLCHFSTCSLTQLLSSYMYGTVHLPSTPPSGTTPEASLLQIYRLHAQTVTCTGLWSAIRGVGDGGGGLQKQSQQSPHWCQGGSEKVRIAL